MLGGPGQRPAHHRHRPVVAVHRASSNARPLCNVQRVTVVPTTVVVPVKSKVQPVSLSKKRRTPSRMPKRALIGGPDTAVGWTGNECSGDQDKTDQLVVIVVVSTCTDPRPIVRCVPRVLCSGRPQTNSFQHRRRGCYWGMFGGLGSGRRER